MEHFIGAFLGKFGYVAIVLLLAAAGIGAPISEDLTLLLAGGLAAKGLTSYWPTLLAGYLGVVIGDVLIYAWGRKLGPAAENQRWLSRVASPARRAALRDHMGRHGFWTVVVGRHTPGLRAPTFFLAGAFGVPPRVFVLADALSAAVTAPLVLWLGFKFAQHFDEVRAALHRGQWVLGAVVVAIAGGVWLWRRRKARSAKPSALEHLPQK